MLIEIIGELPVDSNITSFLQNFILVHQEYINTIRLMSHFLIIARTFNRIPLTMFGSRFLKIYFLDIFFSRCHLLGTFLIFIFTLEKVFV